eukprot:12813850-Ditylum_brightwellii.AAC.1
MSNEKGFADGDDEKKRKRQHQDGGGKHKNKKQKSNGQHKGKDQGEWDLYRGVPDSAACPKHGSHHTSVECHHNPFKKLAQKGKYK